MKKSIMWFRRDLRISDNAALYQASKNSDEILPIFIFDKNILDKLKDKEDRRVQFIYDSLVELNNKIDGKLNIYYGDPTEIIPQLVKNNSITSIYTNRDYEKYAQDRDKKVAAKSEAEFYDLKDSVIFEKDQVLKGDRNPYSVFTPFKRRWLATFEENLGEVGLVPYPKFKKLLKDKSSIALKNVMKEIGFKSTSDEFQLVAGEDQAKKVLKKFESKIAKYQETRDFPSLEGTSGISPYLRFGNIGIRACFKVAFKHSDNPGGSTWLSELIWREFYFQILAHYPWVEKKAFKEKYDKIKWLGGNGEFKAWVDGQTGFPIVDAAMRCFKQTGQMHNRLRMIVASFLCKTLLVDWRKGEKYFADKLMDFELASNNGGWQWGSSSGCDAAPYFRIFNPFLQSEKFDKQASFIKKWVPELKDIDPKLIHNPEKLTPMDLAASGYPSMIVDYRETRTQAVDMYKEAIS